MGIQRARRAVLALASLVFFLMAVVSLVAPRKMAEPLDYALETTNALNEFRAIYVGLWLAHAVILAWAARRVERRELGDVAGILILGQLVGRTASLVLDGVPDVRLLAPALVELVACALIFGLRGRDPGPGGS